MAAPCAQRVVVEDRLAPLPLAILTRMHDSRSPIATEIGLLSPILLSSPLPPPSRIPSSQSAAPQSSRRPAGLSRETRRAACACARGRPPRSAEDTKGRHASESVAATASSQATTRTEWRRRSRRPRLDLRGQAGPVRPRRPRGRGPVLSYYHISMLYMLSYYYSIMQWAGKEHVLRSSTAAVLLY